MPTLDGSASELKGNVMVTGVFTVMPSTVKSRTFPAMVTPVGKSVSDRFTSSAFTVAPAGMFKLPKSIFTPSAKVMGVSLTIVTTVPSNGVVSEKSPELSCSPPPDVEVGVV